QVMVVTVAATALNLVLDYALIFGRMGMPEMGIRGAALATVASGVFSVVAYVSVMVRDPYRTTFATLSGWRFDSELFGRLVRYGMPSGVQFFLDMAGFTAFVLIVGRLGTTSLAATNIAFNINSLAFMPMIGVGIAVSVLVGRYIGMGRPDLATRSTYAGFFITTVYMGTVAALYVLVPWLFTAPFASQAQQGSFDEIRRLTEVLLRFVALYSLFDTMNVVFASALKGAGDTRFVMYGIVSVSALVLVLPTWIAVMVLGMGIMAAWAWATAYVILLGFVFFLRFLQGRWKTMRVIEEPCPVHAIAPASAECPDMKFEP
ncbi:MAG TPA: MATE family efflux transporter, partial [Deltaproteobacteria bacterium]|nr:MATE family efflux transporter [Deltaproteobacteria bacterium]